MNPFANRAIPLSGPASDIIAVTPSDVTDLEDVAIALYVETGGTLSLETVGGGSRTVAVADNALLPVGVLCVNASGTTAGGIHALVLG